MKFESKPVTREEARRAVEEMLGRSQEIHATTLAEAVVGKCFPHDTQKQTTQFPRRATFVRVDVDAFTRSRGKSWFLNSPKPSMPP